MRSFDELRDGIGRVNRAPVILLCVFVVSLIAAVPFSLAMREAIAAHLGSSMAAEQAARGVNLQWWTEFAAQPGALTRTFQTTIIGFAAVLDNLSAVIRERFKIKRQLRVISAHGRLTGMVLAALPPALAVFLAIRVPGHFRVLFEDPSGIRMVVVAIALQLVGAFLIHKITKVDY